MKIKLPQLNIVVILLLMSIQIDGQIDDSNCGHLAVTKIIVHPYYNSINYTNDIAIVRISPDAEFNAFVQPICLWKTDTIDLSNVVGKSGTVVGWGITETGRPSNVLQELSMPVVDFHACLESDREFFGQILSKTNFCAGWHNGTSVCQGDSGGSMSFKENDLYYIRGIVSVGRSRTNAIDSKRECDSMQYAVFTDVAQYIQWIKESTAVKCETKDLCYWESTDGSELAARSTEVVVINKTNKTFTLDSSNCDEGGFTNDLFPDIEIKAKASTVYGMESHGFASGCACTVAYTSRDNSFFEITSRNPYIGKNSIR